MPFQLVASDGNQTFELPMGMPLVLGRALNSDIPVFDPTISRRHAEVKSDATGVDVRDLGSSNGTFLNGAKVAQARLSAGDVIGFGRVTFRVRETAPVRPEVPTPSSTRAARGSATVFRRVPDFDVAVAEATRPEILVVARQRRPIVCHDHAEPEAAHELEPRLEP